MDKTYPMTTNRVEIGDPRIGFGPKFENKPKNKRERVSCRTPRGVLRHPGNVPICMGLWRLEEDGVVAGMQLAGARGGTASRYTAASHPPRGLEP